MEGSFIDLSWGAVRRLAADSAANRENAQTELSVP